MGVIKKRADESEEFLVQMSEYLSDDWNIASTQLATTMALVLPILGEAVSVMMLSRYIGTILAALNDPESGMKKDELLALVDDMHQELREVVESISTTPEKTETDTDIN